MSDDRITRFDAVTPTERPNMALLYTRAVRDVISRWEGIGAYRRALSSYDVRLSAIPFLSLAIDEPSAFEIVHARTPEGAREGVSGLAADARSIGLGFASGPDIPAVQS